MAPAPIPPAPTMAMLRRLEALLPDPADLRQDDVPRIAVEFVVGERHPIPIPFVPSEVEGRCAAALAPSLVVSYLWAA